MRLTCWLQTNSPWCSSCMNPVRPWEVTVTGVWHNDFSMISVRSTAPQALSRTSQVKYTFSRSLLEVAMPSELLISTSLFLFYCSKMSQDFLWPQLCALHATRGSFRRKPCYGMRSWFHMVMDLCIFFMYWWWVIITLWPSISTRHCIYCTSLQVYVGEWWY